MTPLWHLSLRSIANRRLSVTLTVLSIALAVAMLIGVERLRNDAREGFARTLAGTDLVVGARGGAVQLLLYSVFHIGDASNEVSWASMEKIAALPDVDWLVPIALGDSHRGFRVVGSTPAFFAHYRYGDGRALDFAAGRAFGGTLDAVFEAVVGAEVAARHGYRVGDRIVLSHGSGAAGLGEHDDRPFTVVGVLARNGTPLDRAVLVGLAGIEAIHVGWQGGAPIPGLRIAPEQLRKFDLRPRTVSAALVGLKSRVAVFRVQRQINAFADEPLTAVLPGVALQSLWGLVGIVERALLAVSALVVAVGLSGLVAVVVASLGERRRELAILRALGAGPGHVLALLMLESLLLATLGIALGLALVYGVAAGAAPWLAAYGLQPGLGWPGTGEWWLLLAVFGASAAAGLVPGWRAYRYSVADGMTIRI